MNDRDRAPERGISADAVETLVWLAESKGVDRRRYRIVNRLRSVRDSDEFATLPEDLRERVREIVTESER
jgi:predicted RNase H-like nuclease